MVSRNTLRPRSLYVIYLVHKYNHPIITDHTSSPKCYKIYTVRSLNIEMPKGRETKSANRFLASLNTPYDMRGNASISEGLKKYKKGHVLEVKSYLVTKRYMYPYEDVEYTAYNYTSRELFVVIRNRRKGIRELYLCIDDLSESMQSSISSML